MDTDYFPVPNCKQQQLIDDFVGDLSKCFQINIRTVCLQDLWEDTAPFDAHGQPLQDYLRNVGQNSFFYDFYHSSDSFREEYERKYHRAPAVNAVTKWRWKIAKGISKAQRDDAVRRLDVYKKWLLEQVVVGNHPIVILPVMDAVPTYRDDPPSSPATQEAWHQLWMAPILGSPEVTLPIGQMPYHSRVSEREEQLPVAISLMGLPGTDISLINTAKTVLEKSGRPCRVATGREMFVEDDWEMVERTALF
ncbi:hypothetical protein PRZ48_010325 [Zasmidium cellare]|uniref:Amidase domain-containing protein n=1 Tax=Zasmidium cellare TaxID=395010 RepID=A0ABR0E8B1_ZASCE|nr:hypothetical protein PRZ48_010325 [Zasmidium cellare]